MKKQANNMDWESNRSSASCTLCQSRFTIISRRHHCRNCGRLVCGVCSSNKARIFDASVGKMTDDPQRVCDPCFSVVAAKEAKITKDLKIAEIKLQLLNNTSYLSDCLIDIYCLDGHHKTVCFDQSTTVGELASTIFTAGQLAMFEVIQDIYDSRQYELLTDTKLIFDVIRRWRDQGLKFAKIVLPLKDSKLLKQTGVIKKQPQPVPISEDKTSFDTQPTEQSAEERAKALEEQVMALKQELQVMSRKNETFRAVYRGRGQGGSLDKEKPPDAILNQRSAATEVPSSIPSANANNSSANNAPASPAEATESSRRDSFKWGSMGSSFFRSSSSRMKSSMENAALTKPEIDSAETVTAILSVETATRKTKSSNGSNRSKLEYNESNMPALSSSLDVPVFEESRDQCIHGLSSDNQRDVDGISIFSPVPFGNNPLEVAILAEPRAFFKQSDGNLTLFVQTFFNHVVNLEGFLGRYSTCLELVMKHIADGKINPVKANADGNDDIDVEAMLSSWIIAVYHMGSSMDTLYLAVAEMVEVIRPHMHSWLNTMMSSLLKLPPSNPEALKAVFLCLWKERLLFEDEIRKVLENALEQSMKKDVKMLSNVDIGRWWSLTSPQSCSFAVIELYLANIISTQRCILGDLISVVPPELACTSMFQDLSWQIWDEVIKPWYRAQAMDLTFVRAMAIYQFLETYADLLLQFGRDADERLLEKVKVKKVELFKLTCTALVQDTKNVWKSCQLPAAMEVIQNPTENRAQSINASTVSSSSSSSLLSSPSSATLGDGKAESVPLPLNREPQMRWTQELLTFVNQVLTVIVDYHEPLQQRSKIRATIVVQLLDTLFENGLLQLDFVHCLRASDEDYSIKIAAFLNSQLVFSHSLSEMADRAMNHLPEDVAEMLDQKIGPFIQQREDVCDVALEILARQWATEIKRIFEVDLFKKQWETEIKTIQSLKKTLRLYFENFKTSLITINEARSAALRMQLTGYICEAIVHGYIECLLNNNHGMMLSVVVIERLNEDLQLITALIEELRVMMLGSQEVHRVQSDVLDSKKAAAAAKKRRLVSKTPTEQLAKDEGSAKDDGISVEEQLKEQQQKVVKRTIDYQNKQSYDLMIQPLTRLILAVQMSKQYLIPFVREELYQDFGPFCLKIWCLIEHWRGEKKEQILQDYDQYLRSWQPPPMIEEPRVNISFINKVRAANQVKYSQPVPNSPAREKPVSDISNS